MKIDTIIKTALCVTLLIVTGSSASAQNQSAAELIGDVAIGNAPQPNSQINVPVLASKE